MPVRCLSRCVHAALHFLMRARPPCLCLKHIITCCPRHHSRVRTGSPAAVALAAERDEFRLLAVAETARREALEREHAEFRAAHARALGELSALRRADFFNPRQAPAVSASATSTAAHHQAPQPIPSPSPLLLPLSDELKNAAHFDAAALDAMWQQQYLALLSEVSDGPSGWAVLARAQNDDVQRQFVAAFADACADSSARAARRAVQSSLPASSSSTTMPATAASGTAADLQEPRGDTSAAAADQRAATPGAMKRLAARCLARSHLHEAIKDTVRPGMRARHLLPPLHHASSRPRIVLCTLV
jgi:hypothetical protein